MRDGEKEKVTDTILREGIECDCPLKARKHAQGLRMTRAVRVITHTHENYRQRRQNAKVTCVLVESESERNRERRREKKSKNLAKVRHQRKGSDRRNQRTDPALLIADIKAPSL